MMFDNKRGSKIYCFWIAILLIQSCQCKCDEKEKNSKTDSSSDSSWKIGLCIGTVSAVAIGGVTLALPLMGFTAAGVSAGSIAAAVQSAYLGGTITSGGLFAILQSLGVTGLSASAKGAIIAAVSTICGVTLKDDQSSDQNTENSGELAEICG